MTNKEQLKTSAILVNVRDETKIILKYDKVEKIMRNVTRTLVGKEEFQAMVANGEVKYTGKSSKRKKYYVDIYGELYSENLVGKYRVYKLGVTTNTVGYRNTVINGKGYYVHRLVLETFKPVENMKKLTVQHKDGNKLNNTLENLEWMTQQDNVIDAYEKGLMHRNKSERLDSDTVNAIRQDHQNGLPQIAISERYGVAYMTVNRIVNKKFYVA